MEDGRPRPSGLRNDGRGRPSSIIREDLLMDPCGPASAGGESYFQLGVARDLGPGPLVVAGDAVGVHAVLVRFQPESPGRQEGEVDFQVAAQSSWSWRRRTNPCRFCARPEHIRRCLASSTFVSSHTDRNGAEEFHHLRLPQVVRRTVGQHLQRAFKDHIHAQLMAARAHGHGAIEDRERSPSWSHSASRRA